jgi:hypothetical protein
MDLFPRDKRDGVFRGFQQGGLEFHADLVLPHRNDLQNVPMHGQFLLVQLEHEDEAVLGRIASFSSEGKLAFGSGEEFNIRAMLEDRAVPDDLREQYLRYRVNIRVLGCVRVTNEKLTFVPSHRRLPQLRCRSLASRDARCTTRPARKISARRLILLEPNAPYLRCETRVRRPLLETAATEAAPRGSSREHQKTNRPRFEHAPAECPHPPSRCAMCRLPLRRAEVWDNVGHHASGRIRLYVRFGGIGSRKAVADDILRHSFKLSTHPWRVLTRHTASSAKASRRQAVQMQAAADAIEESDYVVILS